MNYFGSQNKAQVMEHIVWYNWNISTHDISIIWKNDYVGMILFNENSSRKGQFSSSVNLRRIASLQNVILSNILTWGVGGISRML